MAVQVQLRHDTAANWTAANPTLAAGEVGTEVDTLKFKVGNGSTAWNSLAYASPGNQGNQGNQGAVGAGTQGNQGNQGNAGTGVQTQFAYRGTQAACTAQTVTDIFTAISVPVGSQWFYEFVMAAAPALGVQGCQVGIQCSVAGATVEGYVQGPQTVGTADKSYRQAAQGSGTLPTQMVAGNQSVRGSGIIIAPGTGTPAIGVQLKGVQASQAWYVDKGVLMLDRIA